MTNGEKKLLLKDFCARLPYGVKVRYAMGDGTYIDCGTDQISIASKCIGIFKLNTQKIVWRDIEYVKPYLRPMSSMTEKERAFYAILINTISETQDMNHLPKRCEYMFNWLRANHFDYDGLIEKGLALEALEGMYEINN